MSEKIKPLPIAGPSRQLVEMLEFMERMSQCPPPLGRGEHWPFREIAVVLPWTIKPSATPAA